MGYIKSEEGFHSLYAMSPYQHVHDGVAYPAVLYTTGANDPRLAPTSGRLRCGIGVTQPSSRLRPETIVYRMYA